MCSGRLERFCLISYFLLQLLMQGCRSSVSLDAMVVPQNKQRGDNATLLCKFTHGIHNLHSLKWYKDEVEFYRYEPWNMENREQVYEVPGIRIDIGDLLQLNCTSQPSSPAADLKWEINKKLVSRKHYIFDEQIQHGRKLKITRIGLQIRLTDEHFHWGKLKVACIGEIKAVFWERGVENIYLTPPEKQYKVLESSEGYWIANGAENLRSLTFGRHLQIIIALLSISYHLI